MRAEAAEAFPDRARRMRWIATGLLAAMACLFVAVQVLAGSQTGAGWGYLRAFAEAALVGGLADWFAVTALFRRPLGLPIPHTAIIPTNKDRIADSMARFLRDNFLTPQVVARRMTGFNLAAAAGAFLAAPRDGASGRLRTGAGGLLADVLESLDPQRLGLQVRAGLARQIGKVELAPLTGQMLGGAIAEGRHLPLIESAIRWAGHTLEANEDLVREMIRERASGLLRWTGLDGRIANSVLDGLYKLMAEMIVQPDHPLRAKLDQMLGDLALKLQHDPETRAKVERAKTSLLANPALADWWQGLWDRLRLRLIAAARDPEAALGQQFSGLLAEVGQALQRDTALQAQINRFARRTLVGVTARHGDQIVRLVSETVKRWDAGTITSRMERAVGRDLQFIRINGTLVGGLLGLALHAVESLL